MKNPHLKLFLVVGLTIGLFAQPSSAQEKIRKKPAQKSSKSPTRKSKPSQPSKAKTATAKPTNSEPTAKVQRSEPNIKSVRSQPTVKKVESSSESTTVSTKKKPVKMPKGFRSLTTEILTWQETIKGEKNGESGRMESKSNGILLTYDFVNYFSGPRWAYYFSPSIGAGNLKGQIQLGATPDGLENQIWILAGGHAGLIYRTSPVSQWGIGIPVYYRSILWNLKSGSALELDKKTSYTTGVEAFLGFAATKTNYIRMSVSHQAQWDATIWGLAWQHML